MDMETYEETRLAKDDTWAKYMKEGLQVALIVWNDKVCTKTHCKHCPMAAAMFCTSSGILTCIEYFHAKAIMLAHATGDVIKGNHTGSCHMPLAFKCVVRA